MLCIKVLSPPSGGRAPIEIREKWVGLILPIRHEERDFFRIPLLMAVEILTLHQPETGAWWRERVRTSKTACFTFNKSCCEEVDGMPSFIDPRFGSSIYSLEKFVQELKSRQDGFYPALMASCLFPPFARNESENPEWPVMKKSALTRPLVIFLADVLAGSYFPRLEGAASETEFNELRKEGHAVLSAIHSIANANGVAINIDLIDQPICYVEFGLDAGVIKEVDGGIELTEEGKQIVKGSGSPGNLTLH